mmetsp:Transcript_12457/g.34666  ORF Transcript_12457/g.34666 Transcript_12457/m.34666 type:complete len:540 (-) Transcript_12457:608-2227(-)
MRAGRFGEEEPHWITLVSKGRLDPNENVSELLSKDEQVLSVGVEGSRGRAPVLLQRLLVQAKLLVLWDGHLVRHIEVLAVVPGLRVVQDGLHELLVRLGELANIVALVLETLQDLVDGSEDVEVRRGTHVALVRREAEDRDADLLVPHLLLPELRPLDGPVTHGLDPVVKRVALSRPGVPSGEDDGLEASVQLWQGDLQGDLDGVEPKARVAPLLGRLENEGQGDHVRHVEGLQGLDGLWVVLPGWPSDKGKAGEGDHAVHVGLGHVQRVEEELLARPGEVESSREDGDDLGAPGLQVHDGGGVVRLVPGDQVSPLQDQADDRGVLLELHVPPRVVPVEVLLEILVHGGGHGVPDPRVREDHGLRDLDGGQLAGLRDVGLGDGEQEVLQVLRGPPEPVLQGKHEVPRVLGLVRGEVLEHGGQGPHELEHGLLKAAGALLLLLLHEAGDDRLGLAKLRHGEGPELVQPHHRRHGGEDQAGVEPLPLGLHGVDHLVGELLDEDQRADEHVRGLDVLLELLVILRVPELLEEVAHNLDAHAP